MVATRIDLDDIGRGRFDAFLGRDKIVSGSRQPALDACRVLKALGITGTLEVFHAGSSVVAMRIDIERGAGLTVDSGSMRFVRYRADDALQAGSASKEGVCV